MKNSIKLMLLVMVCITQLSCKNDDDTTIVITENLIIGEWLRSDHLLDTTIEYKLHFLKDNTTGLITNQVSTEDGIISSVNTFNWSFNNTLLIITKEDATEIITTVQFLDNGNLYLANFSELEFIRQ